jgi:hypothetical protein
MRNAKPWQIVLLVLAVIAVIASTIYSLRNSDDLGLSNKIPMVDVITGDRYIVKLPKSGSMEIPGINPTTKETTLLPYWKDEESGQWKVIERYASSVVKKRKGAKLAVDPGTWVVTFSEKEEEAITAE